MKAGNMGAADNAAVGPRPEGARLGSCRFGPHPQVLLPMGIRRRPVTGHQPACPQLAQARSLRKGFAGRQSVVVSRCSDWGEKIPAHLSAQGAGNFGHRGHQLEMFSGHKEAEGGAAAVALTPPPAPRTPLLRDTWAPTWARRPLGVCSIRHLADASITNMQVVSGSGGQKPSTTQASLLVPRSPWANQEKASHRGQGSGELQ